MGSLRKNDVFNSIRVYGMEFFNGDYSVPPKGSILTVVEKGKVVALQDISVNSITLSGGVLTYTDGSGLLVNGSQLVGPTGPMGPTGPTGSQGPTGPTGPSGGGVTDKIRFFTFSNQNANPSDPVNALLTWPAAFGGGVVDAGAPTPSWICSVVGISYNYTVQPINLQQIAALCNFIPGTGWHILRIMRPTLGFMGFHIMAVPIALADDQR